jgi:hypothetical protein
MPDTLMQRLFSKQRGTNPELPFACMSLNALVFLDPASYAAKLQAIFGADQVAVLPAPDKFSPAILTLRAGPLLLLAFQGTSNWPTWARYFTSAGAKPFGPSPGVCFAPFVDAANAVQPAIGSALQDGDQVLFTGHSLGAAIAGMLNSNYTRAGLNTQAAWLFACPRFGDPAFFAAVKGQNLTLNLAADPVPYLPPDVWQIIQRGPDELRWEQIYERFAASLFLPPWEPVARAPERLDFLVQLAAANLDWSQSPHNTYQYIRAAWSIAAKSPTLAMLSLNALITQLGLWNPWPTSSAEFAGESLASAKTVLDLPR